MSKVMKEWTVDAKWGKIASVPIHTVTRTLAAINALLNSNRNLDMFANCWKMISQNDRILSKISHDCVKYCINLNNGSGFGVVSWGEPTNPPILLVHGYMDSAATFILLVEQLPDTFYYVAFDMPGHGKSDPFFPGPIVSHLNIVETVRLIVKHMKWNKFVYLSHSMGFSIGILYNHLFPGKIVKMVHIDPAAPLSAYYYPHHDPTHWYLYLYDMYYSTYERWNAGSTKRLTLEEAVQLLVRNRSISEDQAEVVLSRSLVPTGDGKFKFSWEPRMKKIATVAMSEETLFTVITDHAPPTLIIEASENVASPPGKQFAANIIEKCLLIVPDFFSVTVTGGHDVHITHPENVALHIKKFLKSYKDSWFVKCKL